MSQTNIIQYELNEDNTRFKNFEKMSSGVEVSIEYDEEIADYVLTISQDDEEDSLDYVFHLKTCDYSKAEEYYKWVISLARSGWCTRALAQSLKELNGHRGDLEPLNNVRHHAVLRELETLWAKQQPLSRTEVDALREEMKYLVNCGHHQYFIPVEGQSGYFWEIIILDGYSKCKIEKVGGKRLANYAVLRQAYGHAAMGKTSAIHPSVVVSRIRKMVEKVKYSCRYGFK